MKDQEQSLGFLATVREVNLISSWSPTEPPLDPECGSHDLSALLPEPSDRLVHTGAGGGTHAERVLSHSRTFSRSLALGHAQEDRGPGDLEAAPGTAGHPGNKSQTPRSEACGGQQGAWEWAGPQLFRAHYGTDPENTAKRT